MTIPHITPEIAAHVLSHFGCVGGYPGSPFVKQLLAAFAEADATNRARLAAGFPGYAAAFELAAHSDNGKEVLHARASDDA